jgi:hypothetical protein
MSGRCRADVGLMSSRRRPDVAPTSPRCRPDVAPMSTQNLPLFLPGQDCVCLIAPQPYNPDPPEAFDMSQDFDETGKGNLWYATPQLFFKCSFCRAGSKSEPATHVRRDLMFFSTFEPIDLTPNSHLQQKGMPMLYDHGDRQLPSLYVCPIENVLGRVPLIPCYLDGNATPTIPHHFRNSPRLPRHAQADGKPDSGTGSNLYEVNIWMWKYGRAHPRRIPVAASEERRRDRVAEARRRGWETRKARQRTRASAE